MQSNNKNYLALALAAVILVVVVIAGVSIMGNRQAPGPSADVSKPASLALLSDNSTQTAAVGDLNHIRWTSTNYAAPTVAIDIVRKISNDPAQYVLVRQITASTPNTGDYAWTPSASDIGHDTYIQVACTASDQACTATPLPPQSVGSN